MYENNYPNQYENTNTYHYTTENSHIPKEPEKPKKSGGAGKKIALGICWGLLFGVFAGLGFTAVTTASEFLIETSGLVSESAKPEDEEDRKEDVENDAGDGEEVKEEPEDSGIAQSSVPQAMITDVTEVVKAVMPSVVSVNNKYIETTSFFGQQYSSEGNSSGSGIIVGENETELLLVTNYHVVEEAEELSVQFCDGSQAQAQMKGSDRHKDLAVIAVQIEDIDEETKNAIAIATLGDSTQLTVGEPVIAIGNALGYGQSVTTGVVSALNRPIGVDMTVSMEEQEGDEEINTFIQTDAAINPGNSGGALLNIKGEVIGINSNKIGGTAVEGMGYAIPISDAHPIIENLMARETKLRVDEEKQGYLGITGIDVVAEYSEIYGMPMGVYVSSVSEGTGAHKAGLVRGDVITAVNDQEISSMVELKEELTYYAAGDTVELTIMQGSPTGYQAKKVSVTLSSKELMEQ